MLVLVKYGTTSTPNSNKSFVKREIIDGWDGPKSILKPLSLLCKVFQYNDVDFNRKTLWVVKISDHLIWKQDIITIGYDQRCALGFLTAGSLNLMLFLKYYKDFVVIPIC